MSDGHYVSCLAYVACPHHLCQDQKPRTRRSRLLEIRDESSLAHRLSLRALPRARGMLAVEVSTAGMAATLPSVTVRGARI